MGINNIFDWLNTFVYPSKEFKAFNYCLKYSKLINLKF